MHELIRELTSKVISLLIVNLELGESFATKLGELVMLFVLIVFSYFAYRLTAKMIRSAIIPILQRTKNEFDDFLVKHHFFRNISFLVPALILYYFTADTIQHIPILTNTILSIIEMLFVIIVILIASSILDTINDYYNKYDFAKDHPIKGVIQIIKLIFYIIGFISIIAVLFDKDLSSLVLSLGAASAVFMLVFKDPILGFVGGLQLIFNKMLSIGDWISMPKFGADGTVLEINLTTVKVQNWDKTIITIPTYSLISDSFQNWKGMEEAGGRRIKRAIYLDMNSIKFCTAEMLEHFRQIKVLDKYIDSTEDRINKYNAKLDINPEVLVNGRRQTNIGVFRAYLEAYLKNRSDINTDLTFMIRQLSPGEKGLPIQIYVFTSTTDWVTYEGIQSDIFDHVLAVIPEFDLKVYQYPTDKFFVS